MDTSDFVMETCEQIVREQLPNLFRLYLNPHVTQTCFCLERYVQTTWQARRSEPFQIFLANGFDEALSGAIKLARYDASKAGRSTAGLVFDGEDGLGPFASSSIENGIVEFLPGLVVVGAEACDTSALAEQRFGFVVLRSAAESLRDHHLELIRKLVLTQSATLIVCVDRVSLTNLRARDYSIAGDLAPDIVVFDETFTDQDVPFGAFTARKTLYDHWNRPGKTTFHSTTYQPNTIASLHFMRCLEKNDPEFHAEITVELRAIDSDIKLHQDLYRRLYSPSLTSAIVATGFTSPNVRASGDFVFVDDRKIFDGVSGVACSVRGHNPCTYTEEIARLPRASACETEVGARLRNLTGLDHVLPAVSGGGAVENALKLALIAQFPRKHVLALKSGFGGKTLFALTGTANPSYKEHIDPLYANVVYVDPFATNAAAQIDAVLSNHPIAVVQLELIQGVGGVRRIPEHVVRHLDAGREKYGYLLFVDEVQTGMHRTGPFTLSRAMGITPDLLVTGKAVSDMMFPFALLLYSTSVQAKLDRVGSTLPAAIRERYGYDLGYKTVLNVLRFAEETQLAEQVAEAGARIKKLLTDRLASCPAVRDIRVYGLLIGIELDAARWPQRWFRKRLFWFYLFSMLRHPRYPVLVGFCQYEPNILKITPPLTIDATAAEEMCDTIAEVLRRPFHQLLVAALGGVLKSVVASSPFAGRKGSRSAWRQDESAHRSMEAEHERVDNSAHELGAR